MEVKTCTKCGEFAKGELDKCVLLCSNCHSIAHDSSSTLDEGKPIGENV